MRLRLTLVLLAGLSTAGPAPGTPLLVSGQLRMSGGEAGTVAKVSVALLPSNHARLANMLAGEIAPPATATARSDAAGRFSLRVPEPGVFTLTVEAPGFVPMRYAPLVLVEATELPPVTLLGDAGSRAVVVDRSGEPRAGVPVLAVTASEEVWQPATQSGWRVGARLRRTDERGVALFPRAPGESLRLAAFPAELLDPVAAEGEAEIRLLLAGEPSGDWHLELREPDGRVVAGAVVALGDLALPVGQTDERGRLTLGSGAPRPSTLFLFTADGRARRESLGTRPSGLLELEMPAAIPVSGRILARRQPLAHALVWPPGDPGRFALTGEDGAYTLPAIRSTFRIRALAAGYLAGESRARIERPFSSERAPTLALEPAAHLQGRVVDVDGKPLAGVVLEATPAAAGRAGPTRRAASDRSGRFFLAGLRRSMAYDLTAAREGFTPARRRILAHEKEDASARTEIVLKAARAAFGQILDLDERPLEGAEIRLTPADDGRALPPTAAVSDASGRFHVAALPPGRFDVHVRRPGYAALLVRGLSAPRHRDDADLGTWLLAPGAAIEGRLADPRGEPVVDANLRIAPTGEEDPRTDAPRAKSGGDGRFRFEDLEAGRAFDLRVERSGFLPARIVGVAAPTTEPLAVVLEPSSRLAGRVVDPRGRGVAGARLTARAAAPPIGTVGVGIRRPMAPKTLLSDPDGAFLFEDLAPGPVEVEAFAERFQPPPPVRVDLPAGGRVDEVHFVLLPGATIEGRVTTTSREPVVGARIRVGPARARSDAEGAYRISTAAPGHQAVVVRHLEHETLIEPISVVPGINHRDLLLAAGSPLSGVVLAESGSPVAGARLRLELDPLRGEARRYETASGPEGEFHFPSLVDGLYDLDVRADGHGALRLEEAFPISGEPLESVELVLPAAATVTGRVLGLDTGELAAVRVEAADGRGRELAGLVDHRGRYELRDLGPGVWTIRASAAGGWRQAEVRLIVPDAGPERGGSIEGPDLVFEGLRLRGRITHDEAPLAAAGVTLRGHDIALRRKVISDHRGAFELADLPPGRYRLEVSARQLALLYQDDLELRGDLELPIEIATAQLAGQVVAEGDAHPVEDALIYVERFLGAEGSEPALLLTVPTDARGTFTLGRLSPGDYRLTARKDGYRPAEHRLRIEPGQELPVRLVLRETSALDLRALLPSGRAPALVHLFVYDERGTLLSSDNRTLDESGRARFPSVPPGTWRFLAAAPGMASASFLATIPGPGVELVLAPAVSLEVRIPALVKDNLIAELTLVDANGSSHKGLGPEARLRERWTLHGGAGRVEGVPEGSWTLFASARDGRVWQRTVLVSVGQPSSVVLD